MFAQKSTLLICGAHHVRDAWPSDRDWSIDDPISPQRETRIESAYLLGVGKVEGTRSRRAARFREAFRANPPEVTRLPKRTPSCPEC